MPVIRLKFAGQLARYMAGLPFPDVSMNDPYAGDKLAWNCYYSQGGAVYGYVQRYPHA